MRKLTHAVNKAELKRCKTETDIMEEDTQAALAVIRRDLPHQLLPVWNPFGQVIFFGTCASMIVETSAISFETICSVPKLQATFFGATRNRTACRVLRQSLAIGRPDHRHQLQSFTDFVIQRTRIIQWCRDWPELQVPLFMLDENSGVALSDQNTQLGSEAWELAAVPSGCNLVVGSYVLPYAHLDIIVSGWTALCTPIVLATLALPLELTAVVLGYSNLTPLGACLTNKCAS